MFLPRELQWIPRAFADATAALVEAGKGEVAGSLPPRWVDLEAGS